MIQPTQLKQFLSAFAAGVQDSIQSLQSLLPIMREERLVLTGRNPQNLSTVVARKQAMLQSLEQSTRDRNVLLARLGFPTGASGVDQLLARCADPALNSAWDQLVQLTRQLNLANEMNGQLASQGLRATRGALQILTGREQEQQGYGPRGRNASRMAASYNSLARV